MPYLLKTRLLATSLAILLAASATIAAAEPSTDNLHTTLTKLATQNHICAVSVAIIKNRKLDSIESATGCEPPLALNADSVYQAASLGKPVFAYAVLQLVAQGKLDLDTPVLHYLPQGYQHAFAPFALKGDGQSELVTDPRFKKVTVRMVLNHTSGLPNWASGPMGFEADPGTQWHYSGEGYVMLQRAVEAVTGEPLNAYMAQHVFKPMAMDHSDYVWSAPLAQQLVPGSKVDGTPRKTLKLTMPIAAASLYSSAADYGKFVTTVLGDERLLQQITAWPVVVDNSLNLSWGLGWGVERTQGDTLIWHWGNNPGYRAFVIASVRTGDGFVMLTNTENGLKLAPALTQKVLPGEHKIFGFSLLGGGLLETLCNAVHVCF